MRRKTEFGEKPYNRCLTCHHRSIRCDGPRTSAMTLARWCEFMLDMKEARGLTNAYIAEKSEVSIKTVERLMALNSEQDIMRETARRIENAVIGSSNQYPCYLAYEEQHSGSDQQLSAALRDLEKALSDNNGYRAALDNIHASYNMEMQTIREEAQKKIDYLIKHIEELRKETEYLRIENDRKAKIIDKYL